VLIGLAAALGAAALFGWAAVVQARAVRAMAGTEARLGSFVRAGVRDPLLLLVVVAYLAGFLLHAVAIWLLPLYLAQAAISLSMPCTAILSARQLHEPLGPGRWAAVSAVTVGIVLLAVGAGEPGAVATGWAFALWIALALLAVTVVGTAARSRATLLGAIAGCGYAGSALAVRGIGRELSGPVLVAAIAVPLLGLVAFWLYSLALARTGVAAATAALIVLQTFVPAAVGVAFLGDGVRAGWWAAVAAGLALSVAGAAALSVPRTADVRMGS
jgi:drug/metabolite transporter (DMT)-like permease